MTTEALTPVKRQSLRVLLASGEAAIPLHRIHRIAGYATLLGEPDDYFLGWLTYHAQHIPVFDLNRVVCEQPTPETFGTRILILATDGDAPTAHVGLLAAGATDTLSTAETPLDLDAVLPMLYTMIPAVAE